jgi:preprotein translocase subunit SecA
LHFRPVKLVARDLAERDDFPCSCYGWEAMADLLSKILRAGEGKTLRRLESTVRDVNAREDDFAALSDDELRGKTAEFRERLEQGETLDDLLPEAFAVVREASKRTLGMRHFDVQLLGGAVLHEGSIAEMRTGEGKTLAATLPVYLNALPAEGVHVVTVNDYLARRDADWMRPIYEALGLTVGVIQAEQDPADRRAQYECDITYGTNSEFGFDYLRDNLATDIDQCVQRRHAYAIVDEVDSILIDEARTPLIISGSPEEAPDTYYTFAKIARTLSAPDDYEVDEKRKSVAPSEQGVHKVERALKIENLYAPENGQLVNHLVQALKAESLYKRDVEYVVLDGEVKIIDEFTGRIMEGRRWSEGLHQAVEAKEGVKIEAENVTVATITIQNYFRLYDKLAGMTGTALTEANEFHEIYKLGVTPIPTNQPMVRMDQNDFIYKTRDEKFEAVINDISERHEKGQPVLVGTISVEVSEYLSGLLERRGITHSVLNAKQHEREAEIIKDAGQVGAVTIATNMAGRGVDIKLGDEVRDLGGLYILGTERHESRRIDNQLRGRAGRQGDPGESRFFLSAEDDLVRLFAGDRIYTILDKLGPGEGEPIEHKMLTKRIEGAQKKVEEQNFEIRKNVLKYDDVLNHQRGVVYAERREVLEGGDMREQVLEWIDEVLEGIVEAHTDSQFPEEWELDELFAGLHSVFPVSFTIEDLGPRDEIEREELIDRVLADARRQYEAKEAGYAADERIGPDVMRQLERFIVLNAIDQRWREHLDNMDYLREGIHLRSMAQKDPLVEYKVEGHQMFQEMMSQVRTEVCSFLFHADIAVEEDLVPLGAVQQGGQLTYEHGDHSALEDARGFGGAETGAGSSSTTFTQARQGGSVSQTPIVQHRATDEPGRNDPCPCGSGKKYKRCHGAQAAI